jgi:ADYC domain
LRIALIASTVAGLMLAAPVRAETVVSAAHVSVEGTTFRIRGADGAVLPPDRLPGTIIVISDGNARLALRIDSVERHASDAEITLYALSARGADGGWHNVCMPGPDGRRLAFPLRGRWNADGSHVDDPDRFNLTCTGGAIGKCVGMGYKPWQGAAMAAHHQACVRMVRADYCGDGVGTTRDGTPIDVWDRIGLQHRDRSANLHFEAAWGPRGAVCVARTRIPDNVTLDDLARSCPERLARRTGEVCTEETAVGDDVLILNGS